MSVLREYAEQIMKFFTLYKFNRPIDLRIRPLRGDFYVEYLSASGDFGLKRVDARHLIEKDGAFYLYGWCEKMPGFQSIPVERITVLADDRTGELVEHSNIACWLLKRSLRRFH
jgi:hypothetical protein